MTINKRTLGMYIIREATLSILMSNAQNIWSRTIVTVNVIELLEKFCKFEEFTKVQ